MLRQTQHKVEVNSVTTKTSMVTKKVEKNYKKNVVTQKFMSRQQKLQSNRSLSRQKKIMSR